jgi:hypothetical protein
VPFIVTQGGQCVLSAEEKGGQQIGQVNSTLASRPNSRFVKSLSIRNQFGSAFAINFRYFGLAETREEIAIFITRYILDLTATYNICIVSPMLRRVNIYLDLQHWKKLVEMAKRMTPGTKVSMLIRQAIAEFVERNEKQK